MAINGQTVLVLVNTGTEQVPIFTLVGEQRDMSLDQATGEIDASHKGNTDQVVLHGRDSATLTLDALEVPADAGQLALQAAQDDRAYVLVLVQRSGARSRRAAS